MNCCLSSSLNLFGVCGGLCLINYLLMKNNILCGFVYFHTRVHRTLESCEKLSTPHNTITCRTTCSNNLKPLRYFISLSYCRGGVFSLQHYFSSWRFAGICLWTQLSQSPGISISWSLHFDCATAAHWVFSPSAILCVWDHCPIAWHSFS